MAAPRDIGRVVIAAAVVWHGLQILAAWFEQQASPGGRDFAPYYYATRVSFDGGDPYQLSAIEAAAVADGSHGQKIPFLYPPPFLLTTAWTLPLTLATAYGLWFWANEAWLVALIAVLWRWWRPAHPAVLPAAVAAAALLTCVPRNALMGQMNLAVLALSAAGLWQAERGREAVGGSLLATACVMKISPVIFVLWWTLHGRWRAVAWCAGVGAAWFAASIATFGWALHARFFSAVLPAFGGTSWHELDVPVTHFQNHSIASVLAVWFPAAAGPGLSSTAHALGLIASLGLLVATGWALRSAAPDALGTAAQVGTLATLALLLPAFTWEHHLVWTLPGIVAVGLVWAAGRLPGPVALLWASSCAVVAFDVIQLVWARKAAESGLGPLGGIAAGVLAALKSGALLGLWVAGLVAARTKAQA